MAALCVRCKKNQAVLFVSRMENGEMKSEGYCLKCAKELGMNTDEYDFYLDLRKYGTTHHAGYGLGFERCVMYLTGMGNIRDVLPFPRTVGTCEL